jgi:hypothetical protein
MTEPRNDDRAQARREAAALLGVDIERLSPADNLRVDMVSALRLVIDSEQASVLDGGSADLGKLNVAVQSLIALLPGRELPEPASNREDPREAMWATYKQMRDRGAQFGIGYDGLKLTVERLQAELVSKDAEIAALRAGAPAPGSATPPAPGDGSRMSSYRPAAPAPDPAARVPVLGDLVGVVSDPRPADYVEPDGSIRSTPRGRGKDWGPV